MERARRVAIVALGINLVVILLGALVRATGSGAGCGRSWPTCHGTLVPELEGATAIEFTHRASSGIALIVVAVMVWLAFKVTERGHPARDDRELPLAHILAQSKSLGAGTTGFLRALWTE